jgi:N-acetylglucosaminyldiphosphoundecaprenol N-acetyl-beta-D-mannosaminyltransferase
MRAELFDIKIDLLTIRQTLEKIELLIDKKIPSHVIGVNADKINLIMENKEIRDIVNRCHIVNADGQSMVLAGRLFGLPVPERVAGIDLMIELLKIANEKNYRIAFIGAKTAVLEKMIKNIRADYRNINISYSRNGYFSREEWDEIGDCLMSCRPDIVFVGITSPLKEYVIDYWVENKKIKSVFIGVGGSFDVLAGEIPRAPIWVQKIGMEWFFRMANEPRRLFKRYFFGNSKFIFLVFKEIVKCKMIRKYHS